MDEVLDAEEDKEVEERARKWRSARQVQVNGCAAVAEAQRAAAEREAAALHVVVAESQEGARRAKEEADQMVAQLQVRFAAVEGELIALKRAAAEAEARAAVAEVRMAAAVDEAAVLKVAIAEAEELSLRAAEQGEEMRAQLQAALDQGLALRQELGRKSQESETLHLHIMMSQQQLHKKEAELQQASERLGLERERRSSLELALDASELKACSQASLAEAAEAAVRAMRDEHEREKVEVCRSFAGLQQLLHAQEAEKVEEQRLAQHAQEEMQRMMKRLAVLEEAEAKREEVRCAIVAEREEMEADGFVDVGAEWQDTIPDNELSLL